MRWLFCRLTFTRQAVSKAVGFVAVDGYIDFRCQSLSHGRGTGGPPTQL
jgi:hypothetical protein